MDEKIPFTKILLMGKSGSGKTSVRSMIFSNYIAHETRGLSATINVEYCQIRFLGNLVLSLWDCGGQDIFLSEYFSTQREKIFREVEALVYLFDVKSNEDENDLSLFKLCLNHLNEFSNDAQIFVLLHKMDLLPEDIRDSIFNDKIKLFGAAAPKNNIKCFQSSIYNESIYYTWSHIMRDLIPNSRIFQEQLTQLSNKVKAREAIIFEKETLVIVAHYSQDKHFDKSRFERLSYIVKQFQMCCSKTRTEFKHISLNVDNKNIFFCHLTTFSFLMILLDRDSSKRDYCTRIKAIKAASEQFQQLERSNGLTCTFDRDDGLYGVEN